MTRDFSPIYKDGRCVICGTPTDSLPSTFGFGGLATHADAHLATAEAVVQYRYDRTPPTEQVVPTDSLPVTPDIWDNDHDSFTHKDTNSENERRARVELAATRRRIARAAREAK